MRHFSRIRGQGEDVESCATRFSQLNAGAQTSSTRDGNSKKSNGRSNRKSWRWSGGNDGLGCDGLHKRRLKEASRAPGDRGAASSLAPIRPGATRTRERARSRDPARPCFPPPSIALAGPSSQPAAPFACNFSSGRAPSLYRDTACCAHKSGVARTRAAEACSSPTTSPCFLQTDDSIGSLARCRTLVQAVHAC